MEDSRKLPNVQQLQPHQKTKTIQQPESHQPPLNEQTTDEQEEPVPTEKEMKDMARQLRKETKDKIKET